MKLGVIGLGNMATAMIAGIIRSGLISSSDITGSDTDPGQREKAEKSYGIRTADSNEDAIRNCDYVILAVKPQVYETVLPQIESAMLMRPTCTPRIERASLKRPSWNPLRSARPAEL